jgi:hypothetical protein
LEIFFFMMRWIRMTLGSNFINFGALDNYL